MSTACTDAPAPLGVPRGGARKHSKRRAPAPAATESAGAPSKVTRQNKTKKKKLECAVCGKCSSGWTTCTALKLESRFPGPDRGRDRAHGGTRAPVLVTTCKCRRRVKVCVQCLAKQMRATRTGTSACMRCEETFALPTVSKMLASVAGPLSGADDALVQNIAAHETMRKANTHTECPCHGTDLVREGDCYVSPALPVPTGKAGRAAKAGKATAKATATAQSTADGTGDGTGDGNGNGNAPLRATEHASLCASCFQPRRAGEPCECADATFRTNPYYRAPDFKGMPRLLRNDELGPADVRTFLANLWEMPAGPVQCVCGTLLLRTVDCHQTACSCGFKCCFACGLAGFGPAALEGHYDLPGIAGTLPCAMFPAEYRVRSGGVELGTPYPCLPADSAFYAVPSSSMACHGHRGTDCRHPDHRSWISLYDANRRAAQAEGFVRHLKGTPLYAAAARYLAKQPWYAAYGTPVAAAAV